MLKIIKRKNNLIFLVLVLVLSLPSIAGLIPSGFPLTDDGNWMVIRFSAFYEVLRSGEFPVRFLSRLNNGFGYPVSDFLYPLFMYMGVPIHAIGVSFVDTIKLILIISLLSSSIFSFLWLRKLFDNISSLVGSVCYTYFPYHLYDVYKRGSVGEVLSLAILPFVLWQIERRSLFFASIGIAALITAHNTLAVLFLVLIFPYTLLNVLVTKNKKENFYYPILVFLLGFGISAFFWIPALADLQYTAFFSTPVSEFTSHFSNLDLIGVPALLFLLLTILFLIKKKIDVEKHRLTVMMLIVSLVSIFLATSYSLFFWNFLPSSFIQFPFRFLSLTIVSTSFLAAMIISVLPQKIKTFFAVILISIAVTAAHAFIKVEQHQKYPDSFYSTNQATTTVKNEYMPKWVKSIPQPDDFDKVSNTNGNEKINVTQSTPNKLTFNTYLTSDRKIRISTVYFPGWIASINGKKTTIEYENDGFINLNLNKGANDVSVTFKETGVRMFSDVVSIISFVSLFVIYYTFKRRKILI